MSMDFSFKQYQAALNSTKIDESDSKEQKSEGNNSINEPNKGIKEYFKSNKTNYNFYELAKVFKNINGDVETFLEDGTRVKVGKTNDIIKVGVKYPDGSRFFGSWTNIQEEKEFFEKL